MARKRSIEDQINAVVHVLWDLYSEEHGPFQVDLASKAFHNHVPTVVDSIDFYLQKIQDKLKEKHGLLLLHIKDSYFGVCSEEDLRRENALIMSEDQLNDLAEKHDNDMNKVAKEIVELSKKSLH